MSTDMGGVKLSVVSICLVSNCPKCQIVHGVKLSGVKLSWCQIVKMGGVKLSTNMGGVKLSANMGGVKLSWY